MLKLNRVVELDDAGPRSVATEEFLAQIHRSTELMRENRSEEAKGILAAAFEARIDDPSGHATLGLVYFKLGIYPRALAIYRRLVKDFPKEPTLRLNLGLVYLKTGQIENAVRELENAVRLEPDYRKAHGYLGLAFQRLGEYSRAKQAFERAGAMHLAHRMSRFIPPMSSLSTEDNDGEYSGDIDLGLHHDSKRIVPDEENGISKNLAGFMGELPFAPVEPSLLMKESRIPKAPVSVEELATKARIPAPQNSWFLISEAGYLLMDIDRRGFTRLSGLHFLSAEQISYKPLKRRYRGRSCDELFGDKDNSMFDVDGTGRLGFHPQGKVFSAVSLDGEAVFIRERYLFAMDPGISYENGRIPGTGEMLVHLNGRGAVVIQTPSEPKSLEVTPQRGVILPGNDLVGWFGRLLPKPTSKGPFEPSLRALELIGEGVAIFCLSQ